LAIPGYRESAWSHAERVFRPGPTEGTVSKKLTYRIDSDLFSD